MFRVVGLVIVLIIKAKTYAEEDLYNNNGWKPISGVKVLENLQRKFINTPDTVHSRELHWNPPLFTEEIIGHIEQGTDVNPHDINKELMRKYYNDDIGIDEKLDQKIMTDEKQNYVSEYVYNDVTNILHKPGAGHGRQAKNIIDDSNDIDMQDKNHIIDNNMQDTVKIEENNVIHGKYNSYEVTEDSELSEIENLLDVNHSQIEKKKYYFDPNFKTTTEKDLTDILFRILSNYNIRINDDLTNYAISRNKHNSNVYKHNHGFAVGAERFRSPLTWNSQNHFPIDPILAVFLSNYGYYLPGYYGFPGNYNNIYGYLASNNIHNNKPFGAYKIYSDTDSSH